MLASCGGFNSKTHSLAHLQHTCALVVPWGNGVAKKMFSSILFASVLQHVFSNGLQRFFSNVEQRLQVGGRATESRWTGQTTQHAKMPAPQWNQVCQHWSPLLQKRQEELSTWHAKSNGAAGNPLWLSGDVRRGTWNVCHRT